MSKIRDGICLIVESCLRIVILIMLRLSTIIRSCVFSSFLGVQNYVHGIYLQEVVLLHLDSLGMDLRVHCGREIKTLRIPFGQQVRPVVFYFPIKVICSAIELNLFVECNLLLKLCAMDLNPNFVVYAIYGVCIKMWVAINT